MRSAAIPHSTPGLLQLNFWCYLLFFSSEEVFGFQRLSYLEKLHVALCLRSCLSCEESANVRWNCFVCNALTSGETEAQRVNDATAGASGVWASETRGGRIGGNICSWNRIKARELLIPNSRFLPQNCHMLHQLKKLNIGGQR